MDKRLLTAGEASVVLGLSRSVLYTLLSSGDLASVKIGRARRIPTEAIDRFVAALQNRANATVGSGRREAELQ